MTESGPAVPDGFGLRDLVQGSASNQHKHSLVDGVSVISFPADNVMSYLAPTSPLSGG